MRARATAAALLGAALVSGCAAEADLDALAKVSAVNQSRHVSRKFDDHPVVVDDVLGIESAKLFFPASETFVLCDSTVEAQLRAASIAVTTNAPMAVYDPSRHADYVNLLNTMKTVTVLTVGDVALAPSQGVMRVRRDPGGLKALGQMTSLRFTETAVADPAQAVEAVAQLDQRHPTWLRAQWADPVALPGATAAPLPIQSRRDANMAPQVVATRDSSIASVANARAYGAAVTLVALPDPRKSEETLFAMAGLSRAPLIALGAQFGTSAELAFRIRAAERQYRLR